jgi:ABC-2 type transport system ATP-binding protein
MLEAKHLTKVFADFRAVDDISFEIGQGQCIGLLGLNGAGKTTLLRMLACLLSPTSGTARVDGADVTEDSLGVRRRIGFLPENPPLYGEMPVDRFLAFAARLRGVAEAEVEGRVSEALRRCQLEAVAGQTIETLSYGYKKRVGIAQAIVHAPPLVLLDEPIAGLDPAQIVEMRALIRALSGAHTLLLSSHILTEISQTCDRILVMHKGRIAAQGREDELTRKARLGVKLRVKGSREKLEAAVRGLPGVQGLTLGESQGDILEARLECQDDVRPAVAAAVVGAGLGLLELTEASLALEAVFLSLTGQAAGAAREVRA